MTRMERRIRIASILVLVGLLIECVTFAWKSPLAFFLFLIFGCGIAALGIFVFLVSLITVGQGGAKS
jgi:hypothetical protein